MINADQLKTYQQEGWALERGLIPKELMLAARQKLQEVIDDPHHWKAGHYQFLDPEKLPHPTARAYPGGVQRPMLMAEIFRQIAEHPNLVQAMETLLGGPVRHHTDQFGIKYGTIEDEQGGRSYYHQDSWYWKLPPKVGCNCWIPFHEVGPEAITLAIMPGTHAKWELDEHESYYDSPAWGRFFDDGYRPFKRHRVPLDVSEAYPAEERVFTMEPGDGLFFTTHTWHRSEPNRSGQTKAYYAIAYRRQEE